MRALSRQNHEDLEGLEPALAHGRIGDLSGTVGNGPQELKVAGRKPRPSATQPLSLQDTVHRLKEPF